MSRRKIRIYVPQPATWQGVFRQRWKYAPSAEARAELVLCTAMVLVRHFASRIALLGRIGWLWLASALIGIFVFIVRPFTKEK